MLPQKGDSVIPPLILTALHNLKRGFRSYFTVQSLGTRTKMNINLLIYLGWGGKTEGSARGWWDRYEDICIQITFKLANGKNSLDLKMAKILCLQKTACLGDHCLPYRLLIRGSYLLNLIWSLLISLLFPIFKFLLLQTGKILSLDVSIIFMFFRNSLSCQLSIN